jgi:hypothetical protein
MCFTSAKTRITPGAPPAKPEVSNKKNIFGLAGTNSTLSQSSVSLTLHPICTRRISLSRNKSMFPIYHGDSTTCPKYELSPCLSELLLKCSTGLSFIHDTKLVVFQPSCARRSNIRYPIFVHPQGLINHLISFNSCHHPGFWSHGKIYFLSPNNR